MSIKREDVGTRHAGGATGGRKGDINTEFTLKSAELTFSIIFNSCALVTQSIPRTPLTPRYRSANKERNSLLSKQLIFYEIRQEIYLVMKTITTKNK